MYCSQCNHLVEENKCPFCGNQQLRPANDQDFCFLGEKEQVWATAFGDLLKDNHIPFLTQNVLGAGLAAKMGPALERTRFYVPYCQYEQALALVQEFFSQGSLKWEEDHDK